MEELRLDGRGGKHAPTSHHNETKKEKEVNAEPAKKKWKRRFSIVTNKEYFEHLETGKTQWSAPASFGGTDEMPEDQVPEDQVPEDDATLSKESKKEADGTADGTAVGKTIYEKLSDAKLAHIAGDVESLFQNDLASITNKWMERHLKKLPRRRLRTLIARETDNFWYSGETSGQPWWMNATTDEVLYFPPTSSSGWTEEIDSESGDTYFFHAGLEQQSFARGSDDDQQSASQWERPSDYVAPMIAQVPKNYFEEDSRMKPKTEVARGKQNWRKAASKIKTIGALKRSFGKR
jgi:hypothetical protein